MKRYGAIVIGGGHNGLVTAAYLARAGKPVLVLGRRPPVGGAAVTEEIFPGFKFSMFSYVVSLLRPEIIRDLDLPRHGLHILPLESTVTPMENGDYLAGWADHDETRRELYRHSPRDAEAYDEYGRLMHFMAQAVKPILSMVPPDPTSFAPGDLASLWKLGKHFRGLGAERLHALVKLMTMSSADFLDEWFETDVLKATKSASGIIGTFLGPRSPGTAYVLLHHYMGELDGVFRAWGFAKGGTGAVSEAIASAARSFGAEIRCDAGVSKVMLKNGRAVGVALENGDELRASTIVSSLDPRRTFLQLLEERELPDGASVADLVRELGLERGACAVEVNRTLVPKARHPDRALDEGGGAEAAQAARALHRLGGILGLFWKPPASEAWPADVLALAEQRSAARKSRNWKLSDELRDRLTALGVAVEDGPQGQRLKRK